MNWVDRYVTVWQGRIAFGITFFGALLVGLWPDHAREIDATKVVACVVAGLTWLIAELASATRKVSNHDVALFDRINKLMDEDALTFLREHDFAHNLHTRHTETINAIAEWHGPQAQFTDGAIQKRWLKMWGKIAKLSQLYGDNLVNTDNSVEILTAWHIGFSRHNQPERAHEEVKELNEGAHDVYREYDKFVLFTRQRLSL